MRIFGLAKTITAIRVVCKVLYASSATIRQFVPDEQKALFDARVAAVHSACDLFMSLDWLDANSATTNASAK